MVSSVCFVAIVVTGRLTELSLGTASWRFADIALWVLFVWLAIYTQVKSFDRLTR
jgi:hypothetical protein